MIRLGAQDGEPPAAGTAAPVGQTTVSCTVTDARSQSATCSFAMSVVIAPTLSVERFLALGDSFTFGTTSRTQRVIEGVVLGRHGFEFGRGWAVDGGERRYRAFWSAMGDLDWDAPAEARAASVARWRGWLAGRVDLPAR